MVKRSLNLALVLTLLTGFLTPQWASAHIHLADQHKHGGSEHTHKTEAHAHTPQLSLDHHSDAIDIATQSHHHDSISVNQQYISLSTDNTKKPPTLFVVSKTIPLVSFEKEIVSPQKPNSVFLSYHNHSKIRPRAPPSSIQTASITF